MSEEPTFSKATAEELDALDAKHAHSPQPGDYWHDCYTSVCVVLHVAHGMVILCEKTKSGEDDNKWTWDLGVKSAKSLEEFEQWLSYKSDLMEGKYWAKISPEGHKWVLDFLEE